MSGKEQQEAKPPTGENTNQDLETSPRDSGGTESQEDVQGASALVTTEATPSTTTTTTTSTWTMTVAEMMATFTTFYNKLNDEQRQEHDKIRRSLSGFKGRITRFETEIDARDKKRVKCTTEIRDDYLTRLHELRQNILDKTDDYFNWLQEFGQIYDKEGGTREYHSFQFGSRIQELEERIEDLYEKTSKGPRRAVRFEDEEDSNAQDLLQTHQTTSFRQPFPDQVATLTTTTARMSVGDPSQFSYTSAGGDGNLGAIPKPGNQYSYVSSGNSAAQVSTSTLFSQGASRSLQVSGNTGTSSSGGASRSLINFGTGNTSTTSGGAPRSLQSSSSTQVNSSASVVNTSSVDSSVNSVTQTPDGASNVPTSTVTPTSGIDPMGTMPTPQTPAWPWDGSDGPDVRRQSTSAYDQILEYTKRNTSFMPNPRVPGLTREEQRHFDSMTESAMKSIPKLQLPKFSGDLSEDYFQFRDQFMRQIGGNVNIDKVTKMSYLKTALTGVAREHIQSLTHGVDHHLGYDRSIEMLDKLYGSTIVKEQKAQARFMKLQPLSNMGHKELTRVLMVFSNLVNFHKTQGNDNQLKSSAGSEYRDGRRKLGSFISLYDEWCVQNSEGFHLLSLYKWLDLKTQAAILRSTIDASDDEEGCANYGRNRPGVPKGKDKKTPQKHQQEKSFRKPFPNSDKKEKSKQETPKSVSNKPTKTASTDQVCSYCKMENHKLAKCFKFAKMSPKERYIFTRDNKVCRLCLGPQHGKCTKMPGCPIDGCGRLHHSLLHDPAFEPKNMAATTSRERPQTEQANHGTTGRASIQLGEVSVTVGNKTKVATILLDLGADHTSVRQDFADEMGMKILAGPKERALSVMGGKKITIPGSTKVEFKVAAYQFPVDLKKHGVHPRDKFSVSGWTMPSACGRLPMPQWAPAVEKLGHLKGIPVPSCSRKSVIDIVLGTDHAGLLAALASRSGKPKEPAAHLTRIGWFLFGDPGVYVSGSHSYKATTFEDNEENLERLARVFNEYHDPCDNHLIDTYIGNSGLHKETTLDAGKVKSGLHKETTPVASQVKSGLHKETTPVASQVKNRLQKETVPVATKSTAQAPQEAWKYDAQLRQKFVNGEFTARDRKFPSPQQQLEYDKIVITALPKKGYQASIPWKEEVPQLKNNLNLVIERQRSTLRSLHKHGITGDDVKKIIEDYEAKEYIRRITKEQTEEDVCHYLPFFPVVNKTRATTKVRLVFDCAAVYRGKSLNNQMYSGPNLLTNYIQIIHRFRKFVFALASDISEMFLRTRLAPEETRFHRFIFESKSEQQAYEWLRTLFGGKAMPNVSQKVLHCTCEDHGREYPDAAVTVCLSCYMDDVVDSKMTEEDIAELVAQLLKLFEHADMQARKFITNCKSVMKTIPETHRAKEVTLVNDEITLGEGKILGLVWNPEDDTLRMKGDPTPGGKTCKRKPKMKDGKIVWTLRTVLSTLFKIYDVLSIIGPFTIRGKVILQRLTMLKMGWDEEIPKVYEEQWLRWLEEIKDMHLIKVPRHLGFGKDTTFHIVCYVDASQEAIAAVFYVRCETPDGTVTVRFLFGKVKVTPAKAMSIARLELQACTMGATLSVDIRKYLGYVNHVLFMTDSMDCLWWIYQPSKLFKPYVANRCGIIQSLTRIPFWRKVASKENPADIGSRGATIKELAEDSMWHHGPAHLREKPEPEWGEIFSLDRYKARTDVSQEMRQFQQVMTATEQHDKDLDTFLDPKRHSVGDLCDGWLTIRGRAVNILKITELLVTKKITKTQEELIEDAETLLFRRAQYHSFGEVPGCFSVRYLQKNKLQKYSPFLDRYGIIRAKSRLEYAEHLSYDERYPIILNGRDPIVKLFAAHMHRKFTHPVGNNALRAELMKRFIIIGFQHTEERIRKSCPTCIKKAAQVAEQVEAPLPVTRFDERSRPFTNAGMDFLGPFPIKQGRTTRANSGHVDGYILLFTCYTTRSIHLEPTYNMTTQTVFNALSRFVDRRGCPTTMYSDNQRSFVAMDKELQMLYSNLDFKELEQRTANGYKEGKGIKWVFNTPYASHHGSPFEIHVKAAKRAINAIHGSTPLTPDEFSTALCNAERLINSRPLTVAKLGSNEARPLTPNHFLLGDDNPGLSPPTKAEPSNLLTRWRLMQELSTHFWKRYHTEILKELHPRRKWKTVHPDVKTGGLILEVDPSTPKGSWTTGAIQEVKPSKDGHVRTVEIKLMNGNTYMRPITKIIPLEFQSL